jgi:catalase
MKIVKPVLLTAIAALLVIGTPLRADEEPSAEALIDALSVLGGKPQNVRVSHQKGVCAVGSFTAAPDAKAISTAALFSASGTPALIRFSLAGPNPKVSEKAKPVPRGLAISFDTPDDKTELVTISAPIFAAKTPAQFLGLLQSRAPDPATGKPDPERVKAFNAANPEVMRQGEYLNARPLPASFVDASYFGVHTFYFTGASGGRVAARWLITPAGGGATLTDDEVKAKPDDFFTAELPARLAAKPAAFDFSLQFAENGDDLVDPTVAWPTSRPTKPVGRLTISAAAEGDALRTCQAAMFNPLQLPKGIEPSDDPILLARPAAYAVSLSRRNQSQ